MIESMDEPMDTMDEEILSQLAALFDVVDPPRDDLAEDVIFALSLSALDAELATLQDASELAMRTSSATSADTVTFTSSALQLMVSATPEDDGLRVDGWITGGGLTVELIVDATSHTAVSDVHGRVVWQGIPHGRIRFLMHPAEGEARPVLTPVIEL